MASKNFAFREYEELTESEKRIIKQEFKRDYLGQGFRDRFQISREALRKLSRESRL